MRVRAAGPADLSLLVRHRRAMWRAIGRGTGPELDAHDRRYRRWVRTERAAGRFFAFVAVGPAGRPLGSGAIWLVPSQPRPGEIPAPRLPYILSMYTEPRARRLGVASRLVRAMLGWARAHGYPRVTLHASKMGRVVYERIGFVPTNEMRYELRRRRVRSGGGVGRRRAG